MSVQDIRFVHDFYGAISDLEVALCIDGEDYANRDLDISISKIKQRLQVQYSIDLSGNIEDMYSSSVIGSEVKNFLDNMFFMYNKMCGFSTYFRYVNEVPIKLSKINYIGITKNSLLSLLKFLQIEGRQGNMANSMDTVKSKLGSIPMCIEKKLIMCLYVSYILKLYELVDVLAEILYLGGL